MTETRHTVRRENPGRREQDGQGCAFREFCEHHDWNTHKIAEIDGVVKQHKGQWLVLLTFGFLLVGFCGWMGTTVTELDSTVNRYIGVSTEQITAMQLRQDKSLDMIMQNHSDIGDLDRRINNIERVYETIE